MSEPISTGSPVTGIPALRQQWGPSYKRNLTLIPVPAERATQLLCPVLTVYNKSLEELTKTDVPDIRSVCVLWMCFGWCGCRHVQHHHIPTHLQTQGIQVG